MAATRIDDAPEEEIFEEEELASIEDSEGSGEAASLDDAPESVKRGVAVIKRHWKNAPNGPGVYRMIAENGDVLYVGKAKNVRKRIASYTRLAGHANRIARMIALTADMVFVSTETETEALLLEANLIKQLKPRFNVLMRDDKSFPYILIAREHVAAADRQTSRRAQSARAIISGLSPAFGRSTARSTRWSAPFCCVPAPNSFYENRTRPCLLYQIKRCAGPCTGEISIADYAELVGEARDFLTGKSRAVRERLAAEMTQAAENLEFERAARLRDRISALSAIQGAQGINPRSVEEADVFAIAKEAGQLLHRGVFFPRLSELGQPRLFSARRSKPFGGGSAVGVPGAILRRTSVGAARAALAQDRGPRHSGGCALRSRQKLVARDGAGPPYAQRRGADAAAGRKARARRTRAAATPARRSDENSPKIQVSKSCLQRSAPLSDLHRRRAASKSTTIRIPAARRRSAR